MTDTRPICVKCETSMKAEMNGVTVKYSEHSRQQGDLYECPVCGIQVIKGFGKKYYAPNSKFDYVRTLGGV